MKISFENPDKINGLLTLTIEEDDYKENVEKKLKDYRKKANFPGFRPGQVPMGLIKRQFGTQAKLDEINHLLGEKIYEYVRENNIQMLGEPMPNEEKQQKLDIENGKDFEFVYDIAVAPEFSIELNDKDTVNYYDITVNDEVIDKQIENFASRAGNYKEAEEYQDRDMLKGDLRELDAEGNTKEDGIQVEGAMIMPSYIGADDQKKLFEGAKPGDIITFNPKKAYPDSDVEVSSLLKIEKDQATDMTSDFTYQITSISRFTPAEVNQDLFDQIYGKDSVKDLAEFRTRIGEDIKKSFDVESDFRFLKDVRDYAEKKVGDLTFPEDLLKKIMLHNNPDKDADFVDKNFDASIKELKWHLVKEQLVKQTGIKIDDNDMKATAKEVARAQFAQYGMSNVPEDYLEKYATENILKDKNMIDQILDRAVDRKLMQALKEVVKVDKKKVSVEEFNKLAAE